LFKKIIRWYLCTCQRKLCANAKLDPCNLELITKTTWAHCYNILKWADIWQKLCKFCLPVY
jgi:hypothetical protein